MGAISQIKDFIRDKLLKLRLDVTPNLRNDRQTMMAMERLLISNSNCLDIGAHKGEVTDLIMRFAPSGIHHAFEPIPQLYDLLVEKYGGQIGIHPFALSDHTGISDFHVVDSKPAYSGLKQRTYPPAHQQTSTIEVEMVRLDEVLPPSYRVHFMKLDIEGGEYHALLGAKKTLERYHPIIIFEFGLGAADHYDVSPAMMYQLLSHELGYTLYALSSYIANGASLDLTALVETYEENEEYYFVAMPPDL